MYLSVKSRQCVLYKTSGNNAAAVLINMMLKLINDAAAVNVEEQRTSGAHFCVRIPAQWDTHGLPFVLFFMCTRMCGRTLMQQKLRRHACGLIVSRYSRCKSALVSQQILIMTPVPLNSSPADLWGVGLDVSRMQQGGPKELSSKANSNKNKTKEANCRKAKESPQRLTNDVVFRKHPTSMMVSRLPTRLRH